MLVKPDKNIWNHVVRQGFRKHRTHLASLGKVRSGNTHIVRDQLGLTLVFGAPQPRTP